MSLLTKKIDELTSIIANSSFPSGYTPLASEQVLDPDEIQELKCVANFMGLPEDKIGHTFGVNNNNPEYAPRLTRPSIVSNGETLCVKWGDDIIPLNPGIGSDCAIQINTVAEVKLYSLSVDVPHEDDIITFEFPMSLNKDVESIPSRGVIFKTLASGSTHAMMPDLLAKFRRLDPIQKLGELPDGEYNALATEPITTAAGKVIHLLEIKGKGRYWALQDMPLPCKFLKKENTLVIDGHEFSLNTFTKLRDLEVGNYKVVGYSWGTFTYEGGSKTIATLEFDDGRKVGANARIESLLKNSTPEITPEHPATLFIDNKTTAADKKVKVHCRLVPTKLSGAMAAIAAISTVKEPEAELLAF